MDRAKTQFSILRTAFKVLAESKQLPPWAQPPNEHLTRWIEELETLLQLDGSDRPVFVGQWLHNNHQLIEDYVAAHEDRFGAEKDLFISEESLDREQVENTNFFGINEKSIKNSLSAVRDDLIQMRSELNKSSNDEETGQS